MAMNPALLQALQAGTQGQGRLAAPQAPKVSMPSAPSLPMPGGGGGGGLFGGGGVIEEFPGGGTGGNFKNFGADLMNMLSTHNYNAFNEGPQQRRAQAVQAQQQWYQQQKQQMDLKKARQEEQGITAKYDTFIKRRAADLKKDPDAKVAPEVSEETFRSFDKKIQDRLALGDSKFTNPTGGNVARTFTDGEGNINYLSRDGNVVNTHIKDKPGKLQIVDRGGVSYVEETAPGGEVITTPLDEYQTKYRKEQLSGEAGAKVTGAAAAKMDEAFRLTMETDAPVLKDAINESRALLKAIEGGRYTETGPIEGRFKKYWNADTARLQVKAIAQALDNLKITNLAPVTENELALVQEMYAGIGQDPVANKAKLEEAINMLERKMRIIEDKRIYFVGHGNSLRDYQLNQSLFDAPEPAATPDTTGWSIKR